MPKTEENLAILKDRKGGEVALTGVKVRGRLHGLMAEVEVEQSYANPQKTNIEAIYTFPLPLGATLLGIEVEIAGKKLTGSVVEKKQAERQYEDAITDGNSAIMLEEAGPGLYTVSLGNLMAGESAVIRYRYALLLSWQGDRLRFLLPTTIAPRYGDPQAAGLQPHQVPSESLTVDYPLAISIMVEGELASATIASVSHPISVQQSPGGVVVQLSGKACLDRDFILTIQSDTAQSSCVLTPDREKQVALASLRIPPIPGAEELPLALKVVIDCSGSMAGTSIAQARKAALEILNQLRQTDSFNLTRFGDDCVHFSPTLVMASAKNITQAWNRLEMLDANMGGTEMEKALDSVFTIGDSENRATVLLITDGEIHEHEKLVQRAKQSGHRVFTVGVGNAVAETFLRTLANVTGGACELVAPQEGMRWLRLAADQGYPKAQRGIGYSYREGHGVPQNYEEAGKWFLLAAERGDDASEYALSQMYAKGQGVLQDYEEVVKRRQLAKDEADRSSARYTEALNVLAKKLPLAAQGDADAQEALRKLDIDWKK